MFDSLSDRFDGIFKRLRGRGHLTEKDIDEVAREIRLALLEADVNVRVVKSFIARVKERANGAEVAKSLSPAQQVIKIVHEELVAGARRHDRQADDPVAAAHRRDAVGPAGIRKDDRLGEARSAPRARRQAGAPRRCRPAAPRRGRAAPRAGQARRRARVLGVHRPGRGGARRGRRGDPARAQRRHRRHRRPSPGRRRPDGRAAPRARRDQAAQLAARRRRDDRSGGRQRRRGVRGRDRPRRRDPHQARRRRPRWCRAVGQGGHRPPDPVRGCRREARGLRGVPSRPDGQPHPRAWATS